MKIYRRYFVDLSWWNVRALAKRGLEEKLSPGKAKAFLLDISHPHFEKIAAYLEGIGPRGAFYTQQTKFTKSDLDNGRYSELRSNWNFGFLFEGDHIRAFPGPTSSFEPGKTLCDRCDIGYGEQISPIRVESKKDWGKKQLSFAHGHPGFPFVRREIWESLFKPAGIGCWDVHDKYGRVWDKIVQLKITDSDVKFDESGMALDEPCETCGRKKIASYFTGFFPDLVGNTDLPIFRLSNWMGNGGIAYRPVMVSNEFSKFLRENKVNGLDFRPTRPY